MRSILHRILQFAEDEGAIPSNPVRKVPPPKRRADPEQLLGEAKRRAYTPEEAGRLLGRMPLAWWDHVLTFSEQDCGSVSWQASAAAASISIGRARPPGRRRVLPGGWPVRQRLQVSP